MKKRSLRAALCLALMAGLAACAENGPETVWYNYDAATYEGVPGYWSYGYWPYGYYSYGYWPYGSGPFVVIVPREHERFERFEHHGMVGRPFVHGGMTHGDMVHGDMVHGGAAHAGMAHGGGGHPVHFVQPER